jgi:uncharacterized membrane protein
VKRFLFLDWTRGLAVVIMILCHVFNAWTRVDERQSGAYALSQFIGGMAAPLFLFMAGMTFGFQMDSLDRRGLSPAARWKAALRRGGYVLAIAYAFRLTNYLGGLPHANWRELLKVDILNCMGLAMVALAALAALAPARRAQTAAAASLAIAAAAPLISAIDWSAMPFWLRDYIRPNYARFPFFPWTAYLGFGLAGGLTLRRTPPQNLERLMQWAVLTAAPVIFGAWYFANLPYSLYEKPEFWLNSPMLILIKSGVCVLLLVAGYLWTEYGGARGWSWTLVLGRTSLLAYWVHVMFVYGDISRPFHRSLSIPLVALATALMAAAMAGLGEARLRWSARREEKVRAAAA